MQDYTPNMEMMGLEKKYCPMMSMPQEQMEMMGLEKKYYPMMSMPQEQLETMYPKVYNMIYPHVSQQCDMFDNKYGTMYSPSREQLEDMTDDIYGKVEADVDAELNMPLGGVERQFGYGGRRLLRDLISVLLIRQLLQRRYPYGGYPGGYGGYPGGYGGYPLGYGGYPIVYPGPYGIY